MAPKLQQTLVASGLERTLWMISVARADSGDFGAGAEEAMRDVYVDQTHWRDHQTWDSGGSRAGADYGELERTLGWSPWP